MNPEGLTGGKSTFGVFIDLCMLSPKYLGFILNIYHNSLKHQL